VTIIHEFEYLRPGTVEEALAALAEHGSAAQVLAGGTDLVPWLRDDLVAPGVLVDVKRIGALRGIEATDGTLRIGALATFSDLIESETVRSVFPVLAEVAETVASVGIRNRATVVGNICSAVPSNDAGPVLLAAGALVHAAGMGGVRTIPIEKWFLAPRCTALEAGELVTGLSVRVPGQHGAVFCKLSRYAGEDLAQASVAVLAWPGPSYRIAFGAVAPTTVRAGIIEEALEGRDIDDAAVTDAVALVAKVISPITDIRASAEYRAHLCRVMLARALPAAAARRDGAGPPFGTMLI